MLIVSTDGYMELPVCSTPYVHVSLDTTLDCKLAQLLW